MFSQRLEQRGDRLLDILTDEENGLRLVVSRLGAELISLARRNKDGEWIGFLHRDNDLTTPEKGWGNHATVMGYYLHRLKDGRSSYRGSEITGGTHSFLRSKSWHFLESQIDDGSLRYQITPRDFSKSDYPLNVSLDLVYRVEDSGVRAEFAFTNDEPDRSAHVAFGLHPGFAAASSQSFRLQMPPGKYRRHFSPDNFLSEETEDIDFGGGEMPFARGQLPGSYILQFIDVPSRRFTYSDPPSGRSVILDLTGVPYLTLWSDGSPFLCIEPCWGLTDHREQRAFENKEGIQIIPAGGKLTAGFTMLPELLG
jgi:galactose mutarotase-like enzyme